MPGIDKPKQFPAINVYCAHLINYSVTDILSWSGLSIKTVVGETQFKADGTHNIDDVADHRLRIAEWCELYPHIIIIHHVSMIIEIAEEIAKRHYSGVVVVTGALEDEIPALSDVKLNFGGALVAIQTCSPGVYIVMSGKLFHWYECQRNPITGSFELK